MPIMNCDGFGEEDMKKIPAKLLFPIPKGDHLNHMEQIRDDSLYTIQIHLRSELLKLLARSAMLNPVEFSKSKDDILQMLPPDLCDTREFKVLLTQIRNVRQSSKASTITQSVRDFFEQYL